MSVWKRQGGASLQDSEMQGRASMVLTVRRDTQLAACLLFVVFVSVLAATGWQIWSARQRTLAEIDTHNRNLAQTLDTYAEGVLTQSSMLLLGMAERLEVEGVTPALCSVCKGWVAVRSNCSTSSTSCAWSMRMDSG